jgi:hypothetical protein
VCLKTVETKGMIKSGRGFKVVRKVADGEYVPFFYYFLKGGHGGLPTDIPVPKLLKPVAVKTQTVYKSFMTTRVKCNSFAHALNQQVYPAGIHLWLDESYAIERFHALRALDDDPRLTLVKFRWSNPVAFDKETVVVSVVRPIKEIKVQPLEESFDDEGDEVNGEEG